MSAIKSSILSLLLFSSFTVLATTECMDTAGKIILNSSEDESGASCKCILGYSGTLIKESEDKFLGTCTLIQDSKGVSSYSWVIPIAVLMPAVAIDFGMFYYAYTIAGMPNITREELFRHLRLYNEVDISGADSQTLGEGTDSVFNEVRSNFDPSDSTEGDFELNMTAEGYEINIPMNELLIKEDLPVTPPGEPPVTELPNSTTLSPTGDPDSPRFSPQTEGSSDEGINLEGFSEQVKNVRENIMEEANLEETSSGGEEVSAYFEGQTISNPSIPDIAPTDTLVNNIEEWEEGTNLGCK